MPRNVSILPGSAEHLRVVSPSKVASILGISRWESAYTLWHRMKGLLEPTGPSDVFNVGLAFEKAMAELWRMENPGWRLSPGEVQYVNNDFGFPALATIDRRASKGRARKIVEMKTARSLEDWGDPNLDGDCPADYTSQVLAQQLFTGITSASDLMVMGPFFKHATYSISHDEKVGKYILQKCKDFHDSLEANTPPPLDETVSTYYTVRELHPEILEGVSVEVPESLYLELSQASTQSKDAEKRLRGLKTKMLDMVGDGQFATVNGEKVATRRPSGRGAVALFVK